MGERMDVADNPDPATIEADVKNSGVGASVVLSQATSF